MAIDSSARANSDRSRVAGALVENDSGQTPVVCREHRPKLAARRAHQLIVWPRVDVEPVEARCDLLDCIRLFEGVLNPVLMTVLHLLEFLDTSS